MGYYNLTGIITYRGLEHLPRMYEAGVQSADGYHFFSYCLILRIEIDQNEKFLFSVVEFSEQLPHIEGGKDHPVFLSQIDPFPYLKAGKNLRGFHRAED